MIETPDHAAQIEGVGTNAEGRLSATGAIPGVAAGGVAAGNRLQKILASLVVGLPFLGMLLGLVQLLQGQVGRVELALLLLFYLPASLGVELGFHRFFSHHAFAAGKGMTSALAIFGSLAAQGPVLFWAAAHRRHHAFSDRPGDPHSPNLHGEGFWNRLRGWWHAHAGWMFVTETTGFARYVPDLLKDPLLFRLNRLYPLWVLLGLLLPGLLGLLFSGGAGGFLQGVLWGGLIRIFLTDQVTWSVNSLGHMFGRQPFAAKDGSRNMALLALPTLGGAWHNTHHAFPSIARNDIRPWQLDPSGWAVGVLEALGLAWNVKRADPGKVAARLRNERKNP